MFKLNYSSTKTNNKFNNYQKKKTLNFGNYIKYTKKVNSKYNFKKKKIQQNFFLKFNNAKYKKYKIGLKVNSRQIYFFYKLVNNLIINGKKDKAIDILYNVILTLDIYFNNKDPFFIIDRAIRRSIIVLKIKKKRIAGRVHQVPLFLKRVNQINYSLKSFIDAIRLRTEKTMIIKLISEIKAINQRDFNAVLWKKKKILYTQAISNKFFVKYL